MQLLKGKVNTKSYWSYKKLQLNNIKYSGLS
jgi:hypothetical protein